MKLEDDVDNVKFVETNQFSPDILANSTRLS